MKFFVPVYLTLLYSIVVESHLVRVPKSADSIPQQCVDQGFDGACFVKPLSEFTNMCTRPIRCAVKVNRVYKTQPGNIPKNGTPCGEYKICWNKVCREIHLMPTIEGTTKTVSCKGVVPFASRVQVYDPDENEVFSD